MITAFPLHVKGETIYSIISKYHLMMKHKHYRFTLRNIYNGESLCFTGMSIDLPTKISEIHEATLHFKIKEKEEQWVYDHTAFSYYTYFTNHDVRNKILNGMLKSLNSGIILASGKGASKIKDFTHLRVCSDCFKQEQRIATWYLIHQIPGVFICPEHNNIVHNSSLYRKAKDLVIPTIENCDFEELITISSHTRKQLFHISVLTKEILFPNQLPTWDLKLIKEGYIGLLKKAGYGSYHSFLYQKKIVEDISVFYGEEFLNLLNDFHNFSMDSLPKLWIMNGKIQHPIYHLILINFLYERLGFDRKTINIEELIYKGQSFYFSENNNIDEAKKRMVCLNYSCSDYKQTKYCKVKHTISSKKPIYYVKCNKCGFTYRTTNLSQNYAIIDVGYLLQEKITKMYFHEHMSIYKIAAILKVSEYSVSKALNLHKSTATSPHNLKFDSEKDKAEWADILKNNPEKSKSQLVSKYTGLYKRLYRYEKDWVMSQSYKKISKEKVKEVVNWKERDQEVVIKLRKAYETLLKRYPPVRITKNSLIVEANLRWYKKFNTKLPLSTDYISNVEENSDQFTLRKAKMILDEQKKLPLSAQFKPKRMTHKVGYYAKISKETKQIIRKMLDNHYNEFL